MKKCSICTEYLPLDRFHKNSRSNDGYSHECRECNHKRTAKLREQPAYVLFHNLKNSIKRTGVKYDAVLFSTYDVFWDRIKLKWETAASRYPNSQLTIKRINVGISYCLSNLQVVPSKKRGVGRRPHAFPQTNPVSDPLNIVDRYLAEELNITPEQLRQRIAGGWSLRLLKIVSNNDELADEILRLNS